MPFKSKHTTRLGKALRDLAAKVDTSNHPAPGVAERLLRAADELDKTVLALGTKKSGLTMLASYRKALREYNAVSLTPYDPDAQK